MNKQLIQTEPNQKTEANGWYSWYEALKKYFGKATAKTIWVAYWNKRAGSRSDANTHDLREKMLKEGIKLDTTWTGSLVDGADSVLDTVGGIFKFGSTIGKVLVGGIVIGVVVLVFNVARKPIESAGAASNLMKAKAGA